MAIEVELRSFISEQKYNELLKFFHQNATFLSTDTQETHYFDCNADVRIQQNNQYSKIWMKKGQMHDEAREEVEVKLPREDFAKLQKIFKALGHTVQIKWFRTRHSFKWDNIDIAVDHTKGYGYILELEILADESQKEHALNQLTKKFQELQIPITPKEEFKSKYEHYKNNWQALTTQHV